MRGFRRLGVFAIALYLAGTLGAAPVWADVVGIPAPRPATASVPASASATTTTTPAPANARTSGPTLALAAGLSLALGAAAWVGLRGIRRREKLSDKSTGDE